MDGEKTLKRAGASEGKTNYGYRASLLKNTVKDDFIVCLECGRRLKMLTLHIARVHGMDPACYRTKWGLPPSYPMIARGVSRRRSRRAEKRWQARQ